MGVPKFFRWISERYPSICQKIIENEVPEFDSLYLDMNGIIHTCSHPDDKGVVLAADEKLVFGYICQYLEFIFQMIKPQKVLFISIDGVAPRAKLNQQRARRFKAAKESADRCRNIIKKGENISKSDLFDSNCISPGTDFMCRLEEYLVTFIATKVSEDKLWRDLDVYFSGHLTPGEGEQKIMDFVRFERSKTDYDPLHRHCLYGLDADLILLALATHEPFFTLLREEVTFSKGRKDGAGVFVPEEINFVLLHLSILRDYIDCEFSSLRTTLPFEYDLERIIDDWIFMTFFVGNDFVPAIPNLFIDSEGLLKLWEVYKTILMQSTDYLTKNGTVNQSQLCPFIEELAKSDLDLFLSKPRGSRGRRRSRSRRRGQSNKCNEEGSMSSDEELSQFEESDISSDEELELSMSCQVLNTDMFGPTSDLVNNGVPPEVDGGPSSCSIVPEIAEEVDEDKDIVILSQQDELSPEQGSVEEHELMNAGPAEDLVMMKSIGTNDLKVKIVMGDKVTESIAVSVDKSEKTDIIDPPEPVDRGTGFQNERFQKFRTFYYTRRFHIDVNSPEALHLLVLDYLCALEWMLHYYLLGGPLSWSWFYPQHYVPLLPDLTASWPHEILASEDPEVQQRATRHRNQGAPLKPLQQLMAVLPPASAHLLPPAYQDLLKKTESPLLIYYPTSFRIDKSMAASKYDCVVLLPFISIKYLCECLEPLDKVLDAHYQMLNRPHPALCIHHSPNSSVQSVPTHLPYLLKAVLSIQIRSVAHGEHVTLADREWVGQGDDCRRLLLGVHPGVRLDQCRVGYSIMMRKEFTPVVYKAHVKVFSSASRRPSLVLKLGPTSDTMPTADEDELVERVLGQLVVTKWPQSALFRVVQVLTQQSKYKLDSDQYSLLETRVPSSDDVITPCQYSRVDVTASDQLQLKAGSARLTKLAKKRYGVHLEPPVGPVLTGRSLIGRRWIRTPDGSIAQVNVWSNLLHEYLWSTSLPVENPGGLLALEKLERASSIVSAALQQSRLFPDNTEVFLLTNDYYGCRGKVVSENEDGQVTVQIESYKEIDLTQLQIEPPLSQNKFISSVEVSSRADISVSLVNLITGHVYLHESGGKYKRIIGLNLKWDFSGEQVEGWSARVKTELDKNYGPFYYRDDRWRFNPRIVTFILSYAANFPEVWAALQEGAKCTPVKKDYYEKEIFGKKEKSALTNLSNFLKHLPSHTAPKEAWGSEKLTPDGVDKVTEIVKQTNARVTPAPSPEEITVESQHIFWEEMCVGPIQPDPKTKWKILDRVVKVGRGYSVPAGYTGTIIAIISQYKSDNVKEGYYRRYKVLFDQPITNSAVKKATDLEWVILPEHMLINLTHGKRQLNRVEDSPVELSSIACDNDIGTVPCPETNDIAKSAPEICTHEQKLLPSN